MRADPPGLDLAALRRFLDAAVPGMATGPLRATMIAGGKSNLTYRLTDGSSTWIVRRPPLGHVLETAHDMGREYRVLTALRGTAVPVPATYALCTDAEVLGAPFYVMAEAPGVPYRMAADLVPLGAARTRAVSLSMVDTMAALHTVDPASVGLEDFGRPSGFLARQVHRWRTQLTQSATRQLPLAVELHRRLVAAVPPESRHSVVHGDFRLDNLLIDEQGHVTAVLDWEMATLGDPLTDLALLGCYDWLARHDTQGALGDAPAAPGFASHADLVARYVEVTGIAPPDLRFHLALAFFKLAVVFEGIHFRHETGQTVGDGFEAAGTVVPGLLDAGLAALG